MAVLAQNAVEPIPQVRRGDAQVAPHAPPEQTCPAAQAVPHAPQWALSVRVSTSQPLLGSPSQSEKPAAHADTPQAPAAHCAVALGSTHARPHTPQLVALARTSVSQPLRASPSQSPYPPAHRTTVHAPIAQLCAVALGSAQASPQSPQFAGSTAVFAQSALAPVPQVRSGDPQVAPQAPPEQSCPAVQAVPQPPQCALSVPVLTSQPLPGSRSQSAYPIAQDATAHAPPTQLALAWGSAQARPHAPQCASLAWRLVSHPSPAVPLQSPAPWLHRTTVHAPIAQPLAMAPGSAQAAAQAPQWLGSFAVLAQNADEPSPQVRSGDAQVAPQVPAEQT